MKAVLKGLGVAAMLAFPAAAQTAPTAHVTQGDLTGFNDHGADAYLNIPYGAPPTGDLRWNAPGKPAAWTAAQQLPHKAVDDGDSRAYLLAFIAAHTG